MRTKSQRSKTDRKNRWSEEREDDVERTGRDDKKKMSRHAKVVQVRVGERSSVERT